MWRSLALALVLLSCPLAHSQQPPPVVPTPPAVNTAVPGPEADRPPVPMVWGVAILCTLVILFIVCMPSRKA